MSWFYMKHLKTIGPVDLSEVEELVELLNIKALDLISYKLGAWKFAYEFDEIFPFFKENKLIYKDQRRWIVTAIGPSGSRKQLGPFKENQVIAAINRGEIKYTDLAWSDEMLQWYPISMLEVFNPKSQFEYFKSEKKQQKTASGKKIPKPYLVYIPKRPRIELPPAEADGESLV